MDTTARDLDQFYTRPDVAARLVAELVHEVPAPALWLEPSAGSGAFLNVLPEPRLGLDIDPAGPGIVQADFLTWTPPDGTGPIWVVGNPPFGRASRLAMRFFNHAAAFADGIAFIVPRTFEKPFIQNRLNLYFHLVREEVLPLDTFVFRGAPKSVPCVFQVWQRFTTPRSIIQGARVHEDFNFGKREGADLCFQRVGVRAGKTSEQIGQQADESHYFLHDRTPDRRVRRILDSIDWTPIKHRTAGNPSIGKADLVAAYATALDALPPVA